MNQIGIWKCGHLTCFGGEGSLYDWTMMTCYSCNSGIRTDSPCSDNGVELVKDWEEQRCDK